MKKLIVLTFGLIACSGFAFGQWSGGTNEVLTSGYAQIDTTDKSFYIGGKTDAGSVDGLRLHHSGTNAYIDLRNYTPGFLYFKTGTTGNTTSMTLDGTSGDFGIGVTPSYRLDVYDDQATYAANFFNNGNSRLYSGIRIQCGADNQVGDGFSHWYLHGYDGDGDDEGGLLVYNGIMQVGQGSDRRYKTNIVNTKLNCLETLNKIRVVDYNWKKAPNGEVVHGFIAQELQEVLPEMVHNVPETDRLVITPLTLIPLLVRSAQQQDELIEEKDEVLSATKNEIKALRTDLEALKEATAESGLINDWEVNATSLISEDNGQRIVLRQNDPNPFGERTTIEYAVPDNVGSASIVIYDITGKIMRKVSIKGGSGQVEVFASDLSNGTYTYSIVADGEVIDSRKMIVSH